MLHISVFQIFVHIYSTLLQKRYSFAVVSIHSVGFQSRQFNSIPHVFRLSLLNSHFHSIVLKNFQCLV